MRGRIISTVLLWGILIGVIVVLGVPGAVLLTAVVAALAQAELYQMMQKMGYKPLVLIGIVFGLLISLSPLLPGDMLRGAEWLAPALLVTSIGALLRKPRGNPIAGLSSTILGLVMIPYTLLFVGLTMYRFGGGGIEGLMMGVWLVAATKFTDVGALLSGMAFGKHKMSPILSPKKTWEGAVGGVLVSALVSAGLVAALQDKFPVGFSPLEAALISIPIAVAAIYADLLESAFKRESKVKDSGSLLPGIGGIFDLADSFMLSAPAAYFLAIIVIEKV